jgi:RNA polymerase sigma-70 factor (ECF subfamily)
LLQHPLGKTPATYALAALMTLTAARLPARTDSFGNLIALFDQDRTLWDQTRLNEGMRLLELSASGTELTAYHIEAAIASVHAMARGAEDTDWSRIISLYDSLMRINPSPIVALNRAIATAQRDGPERGLDAMNGISNLDRLAGYPFYPAALGELELRRGGRERARERFQEALARARNPMERRFFEQRLAACDSPSPRSAAQFWESSLEPSQADDREEHQQAASR